MKYLAYECKDFSDTLFVKYSCREALKVIKQLVEKVNDLESQNKALREGEMTMKTLEIGAVRGRHEMPVDKFVFDEAITNFDIKAIESHVANRLNQEVFRHDGITYGTVILYVTGLTVVTTSVMKWCVEHDITLTLMHYNTTTQGYDSQLVYEGWLLDVMY